jgi:hypothetical protein
MMEAVIISSLFIDELESTLQRSFLKVPNDVANDTLQKISGLNKRRASQVI